MSFISSESPTTITNTTVYSPECMMEFYKTHMKKSRRSLAVLYLIVCPIAILLWINSLYRYTHYGIPISSSTIGATATIVFCACIHFILVPFLQKRTLKKHPLQDATVTFCFSEDEFEEQTVSTTVRSSVIIQYAAVTSVTESTHQLYLYNTTNSAYIVSKDGFTQGTTDDLKDLLRRKLDPKKIKFK